MHARLFVAAVVLALAAGVASAAGEGCEPAAVEGLSSGVYAEILPRMELLAGVLSQTSWIETRGPRGRGNSYFRELQDFFAPFREHEAVKQAEKLTRLGFTYDAPPNFLASLCPLPDLEPVNGYSDYLKGRARGAGNLDDFRQALADLARESDFQSFFDAHRDEYMKYLEGATEGLRADAIIAWWREFSGKSGDEYHLVLAPAMFPGGGYGAAVDLADGRSAIYQIIRADGTSEGEPQFPSGASLESLALHEWGHSFINPALGKQAGAVRKLNYLFRPVKSIMQQQAYDNVETFFNEQVLRAAVNLATGDLIGAGAQAQDLADNERRGFYLTAFTIQELEIYRANRDKYPTFDDFVPDLLKAYGDNRGELLKQVG